MYSYTEVRSTGGRKQGQGQDILKLEMLVLKIRNSGTEEGVILISF